MADFHGIEIIREVSGAQPFQTPGQSTLGTVVSATLPVDGKYGDGTVTGFTTGHSTSLHLRLKMILERTGQRNVFLTKSLKTELCRLKLFSFQ